MPKARRHIIPKNVANFSVLLTLTLMALVLLLPSTLFADETVVRIRGKQSKQDASHDYFVKLLDLALKKTEPEYGPGRVYVTSINLVQGRALEELNITHSIDVDWAGTNIEREQELRPIRIPLIGGLLGYRVPVIRRANLKTFSEIRSLAELQKFTVIQGAHWPDADILERAGLPVHRVTEFNLMYPMLQHDRVDYFLRGVNEVYAEVAKVADKELIAFDSLLISYKLPMYFFTALRDEALAERIEKGLRKAIDDGSFRLFMMTHPATAPIFPLSRFDDATILTVPNPELPTLTPLDDKTLWITLGNQNASE